MSHIKESELELKLNLSPPRVVESPRTPSSTSSCVSLEINQQDECLRYAASPEAATSMMLMGCPRCLVYFMLASEEDPRCPKCKSTVLLDVVHENNKNKIKNKTKH